MQEPKLLDYPNHEIKSDKHMSRAGYGENLKSFTKTNSKITRAVIFLLAFCYSIYIVIFAFFWFDYCIHKTNV